MIFLERAAITAPSESRMTTPIPVSSNSLNIAPSQFDFTPPIAGGDHFFAAVGQPLQILDPCFLKSRIYSLAKTGILSRGKGCSWRRVLFRCHHADQAVATNKGSKADFSRIKFSSSGELDCTRVLSTQLKSTDQTDCRLSHPQSACTTSLFPCRQCWHTDSSSIFRFTRFSFVGREFVQAFQRKCLILPDTFILQILFQNSFYDSAST